MLNPRRREYYERNNDLISQYVYIDRLLDSSLPHRLIVDYHTNQPAEPPAVPNGQTYNTASHGTGDGQAPGKIKRTPRNLYRIPSESSPLLPPTIEERTPSPPEIMPTDDDFVDSGDRIVTVAIYVNFVANVLLLAAKIVAMTMTSSLSVLASLVDGALDFLSTAIVWTTTTLIRRQDRSLYPISRRRLEPLSILVFAVVMVTSFIQVAITSVSRLLSPDHSVVELSIPSTAVMASTVIVKLACWFWCRLIKNSSVQALAQDAMTDVIFNLFSILFPLSKPPSPSPFSTHQPNPTLTHPNQPSRLPNHHLDHRPPRRPPPLPLHHLQLERHSQRTHRPPNRCRGLPQRPQSPPLHDDALLQSDS